MMKKFACAAFVIVLSCGLALSQQQTSYPQRQASYPQREGNFSMGFVFGEPTGFAWKYDVDYVHAVDGVVGFSPYDHFRVNVDYLWESHPFNEQRLALHYGPGVAIGFGRTDYAYRNGYFLRNEDMGFGIRGEIGLSYLIKNTPLDVFFDLAPVIIFAPGTGSGVDVGFGARFHL